MSVSIPPLFPRAEDTHKSDYGRVFVLAGSQGMIGAAFLTTEAALRSGAGYVRLGLPWRLSALAASHPNLMCALTSALPDTEEGTLSLTAKPKILAASEGYDVFAAGPGLSQNPQTQSMLYQLLPELNHALVLDADCLNALSKKPEVIETLPRDLGLPIFTPHPGEFARLIGAERPPIEQLLREQAARDFAAKYNVVMVLKGHNTVVSDGTQVYVNKTGNPGMATAGTGDVLTGCIAALRGQGYDSFEAAVLGVYLHGLAGDMARDELGEWGMTANDVFRWLPYAFKKHFKDAPPEPLAKATD